MLPHAPSPCSGAGGGSGSALARRRRRQRQRRLDCAPRRPLPAFTLFFKHYLLEFMSTSGSEKKDGWLPPHLAVGRRQSSNQQAAARTHDIFHDIFFFLKGQMLQKKPHAIRVSDESGVYARRKNRVVRAAGAASRHDRWIASAVAVSKAAFPTRLESRGSNSN